MTRLQEIHDRLEDDHTGITWAVLVEAARYFEECPEDVCLQDDGWDTLTFGGTNRLRWTARHGYFPDKSYCTQKFLDHYERLQEEL